LKKKQVKSKLELSKYETN